jgi:hypothetical protein
MGIRNKDYGLQQIVGRRIKAIVANEREKTPHVQLFLVFDDDTFYEFYGKSRQPEESTSEAKKRS